jgi:hypothetical protein
MDIYEFYRVMAPAIAVIKCGHTGLSSSPELEEELARLPRIPFDVKVLDSHVFRDYVKGGPLAGKEIQSINRSMESLIMRIESIDRSGCAVLCMNGWCEIFKLRLVGDSLRQRRSRRLHLLFAYGLLAERTCFQSEFELKFLSCSRLARQKKRFRVSAFPAQLERAKVFVPRSLGYIRLRTYPSSQLIEILQTDLAVHAYALPDGHEPPLVDATRFRSVALFTEHEAP